MTSAMPPKSLQSVKTKVVGVTFEGRQAVVARLRAGHKLSLRREPGNGHDRNAILVLSDGGKAVGHLSAELAEQVAPWLERGHQWKVTIINVTGGTAEHPTRGVNIKLQHERPVSATPGGPGVVAAPRQPWWRRLLGP